MKRTIPVMFVLVFVSILAIAMACNSPAGGSETIVQGDGTKGNPFKVYDEATLRKVGSENTVGGWTLSAHYIQIKDIQMSSANFTAIGTLGSPFRGSFNGGSYTIKGLTINRPGEDYQGLFGHIIGVNCIVENVGLIGGSIIGKINVGLVGYNEFSVVQNCYITGKIEGYEIVGGIVGSNFGTIQNCYTTGRIEGGNGRIGGIVGSNAGTIQNCYTTGRIEGKGYTGGITGNNNSIVKNCYTSSSVKGTTYTGGVVGLNGGSIGGLTQNCVAINSEIESTNSVIGRVFGYDDSGFGTASGNYAKQPMTITSIGHYYDKGHDKKDGADVNAGTVTGQYNNAGFWIGPSSTMCWDPTIWRMTTGTGNLPKLIGVGGQ